MNILLTIIVIVATLQQTAVGLNCYFCIGSISGDCAKGEESAMVDIPCGRSTLHSHSAAFNETDVQLLQNSVENRYDDLKSACVRFIEPLPGDSKGFARGCAVLPSSIDPCKFIAENLHGTNCKSCDTPLCNKS